MLRSMLYSTVLAAVAPLPSLAASSGDFAWSAAASTKFKEVEFSYFPGGWGDDVLCGPLQVGIGWVIPQGDHPDGVRLHFDSIGANRGPFVQAGLLLSGGQDLGAGVGARVGVGYRFQTPFRVAVLLDGVAGNRKSEGSVGLQAVYTF